MAVASKWSDLPRPWQICFEEAWAAFCSGSLPIGSALFDQAGNCLARGRNHIFDDHVPTGQISLNQLAHAELNTLLQVDRRNYDLHSCSLYTSVEPCPLCMGAVYMSGVRAVFYGARDAYAGSTNLLGTTPYLSKKNIKINGPAAQELEIIFLGLLVTAEMRRMRSTGWELYDAVIGAWQQVCPAGVTFGYMLDREGQLQEWIRQNRSPEDVFNALIKKIEGLEPRRTDENHI